MSYHLHIDRILGKRFSDKELSTPINGKKVNNAVKKYKRGLKII